MRELCDVDILKQVCNRHYHRGTMKIAVVLRVSKLESGWLVVYALLAESRDTFCTAGHRTAS